MPALDPHHAPTSQPGFELRTSNFELLPDDRDPANYRAKVNLPDLTAAFNHLLDGLHRLAQRDPKITPPQLTARIQAIRNLVEKDLFPL